MSTITTLAHKLDVIMQIGSPLLISLSVDVSKYEKGINFVKAELDKKTELDQRKIDTYVNELEKCGMLMTIDFLNAVFH